MIMHITGRNGYMCLDSGQQSLLLNVDMHGYNLRNFLLNHFKLLKSLRFTDPVKNVLWHQLWKKSVDSPYFTEGEVK